MRPVRVTMGRTIGQARSLFSTAVGVCGFLAASAALLAFNLASAEGGDLTFAAIWAVSVSPVLPALAVFLAMDVWCDERKSGRMDMLLTTAVRERDLVFGKYLGVLAMTVLALLTSLAFSLISLRVFSPAAFGRIGAFGLMPAVLGLCVQAACWCAAGVAASALFSNAASALGTALVLTIGLPRGLWAGLMAWSPAGRTAYGEMPFDAHALDMATGIFSLGTVASYLTGVAVLLFVASKCVAWQRFSGTGARGLRTSTLVAVFLSLAASVLFAVTAFRFGLTCELPTDGASGLSARTRSVLAESGGEVSVTCFLPRSDVKFRSVSRFLRLLKRQSETLGGARFGLQFVDPRWDIGAAERLVSRGVTEHGLVFEKGRRMVSVPFGEGFGERICVSAIRRLTTASGRRNVYWTVGHGERAFDDYGTFGMSDIARELSRDGYANRTLDLTATEQIPGDCALILVAGAKDSFSRAELGRLDAYLHEGGRLLVLLSSPDDGVSSLLTTWGVRPVRIPLPAGGTLSGTDVIVSTFSDHPVASSLRGSRILLERPLSFEPSATAEISSGADRIGYAPLARVGSSAVAVVSERGAGAGDDLAIRPTRIVAIGDSAFAMNGAMLARANANRDFFLNCAAYLSGTDVIVAQGDVTDGLVTGLDRSGRFRHAILSAGVLPGMVFLVLLLEVVRRRRRG